MSFSTLKIVLHVASTALLAGAAIAQPSPCASHTLPSRSWSTDSGSVFRIRLPPGLTRPRLPVGSIDSEGGLWRGGGSELSYDFGAYSNPLRDSVQTSGSVCETTIGGRPARVVIYRDERGRYVFGAHWEGFDERSLGQPVSLTIVGFARDSIARDSLLASAWSLTFRR